MYSLNYKVTTSTCDSEGKLKLFSARFQGRTDRDHIGLRYEAFLYFCRHNYNSTSN